LQGKEWEENWKTLSRLTIFLVSFPLIVFDGANFALSINETQENGKACQGFTTLLVSFPFIIC
jgi:hypothetical protein